MTYLEEDRGSPGVVYMQFDRLNELIDHLIGVGYHIVIAYSFNGARVTRLTSSVIGASHLVH